MLESNTYRGKFFECRDELDRCFENLGEQREEFLHTLEKDCDTFFKAVQKYVKTGELDTQVLNVTKEINIESDQENVPSNQGRGRRKKPVLSEISEDNVLSVKVKKEKISTSDGSVSARSSISSTVSNISEIPKQEIKMEQDMPAPSWIPPMKKGKESKPVRSSARSTRTKGKKPIVRDSDVVVQNTTITTINLSDTEESDVEKGQDKKPTRSTRTKTKKVKNDSGTETDSESTRSTRTKTRTKKEEQNDENNVVEETRSTRTKTIRKGTKAEEEKENKEEAVIEPTRSTRTKTKKAEKKAEEEELEKERQTTTDNHKENNNKPISHPKNENKTKRSRSDQSDEETNEKKRSKSLSPVQDVDAANATTKTEYEDAQSILSQQADIPEQQLNSTYVTSAATVTKSKKNQPVPPLDATVTLEPAASNALNHTVVVDKPHYNIFDKKSTNGLLTDDDSIEAKTPPKKAATSKVSKEVFSPYEKTTLKKKVEAFEKLQNGREIPVKMSTNLRSNRNTPSTVKEKAKMFTPTESRFLPTSSSTSKISRLITLQNNNTSSSNESLLAMKSAQKESRDRQKKQLEREQALKKKEAMLLAKTEAKKKLNEEKQLKAQQQRKALEAEKQKHLEIQKQKDAKLKQREQEREEYLQKQKLELEKKRLAQKKKIQEMQAQRQQILEEQAKNPPIYMTSRPPKLPTDDCYDSDDPDYKRVVHPSWCLDPASKRQQLTMLAAGEKIKNTLFCRHAQTPDLTEIFEIIDPKKLKRSSSVFWRKPPRYTMMPDLNETKFEEDDELYESD